MLDINTLTEAQIIDRLHAKTSSTSDLNQKTHTTENKKASVLIPFVRQDDTWHIVFIRRADSDKDRHSGQVAFVGGMAETIDNSEIDTALRETQEEIGVNPADIKILGKLGFHYSLTNFEIRPIVASLPWPYDFTLEAAEVSHTFTMPLAWLCDEENHEIKQYKHPESGQQVPVVYFKEYEGELLWGATARMVLSLIATLKID